MLSLREKLESQELKDCSFNDIKARIEAFDHHNQDARIFYLYSVLTWLPGMTDGEVKLLAPLIKDKIGIDQAALIRDILERKKENRVGKSTKGEPLATSMVGPYRIEDGRICRERQTNAGGIIYPLCNFSARVTEEVIFDDGAETTRVFLIEGALDTGEALPSVRVPVSRFSAMNWVPESWGLRAVVCAGQSNRDYLREAIQRLSPEANHRRIFTHTGWREIGGIWMFLTAGGSIAGDGVEVDLGPELTRYTMPVIPNNPVEAMRQSIQLLKIAPLTVTAPLWAGMFRAPLASAFPLDLLLWLEGQTGSMKSTLAALFLSHFGDFERTHLPGAWSSTANQLERRAFILKDVPFVIDDYAPSALDIRGLETKAARLLRSQGNLSGRGRLRSDLSERPAFPPRGLIVSTGELHPPGQSLLARVLLVELNLSDVSIEALTKAQRASTRLSHAMSGYLHWLATQMPRLPALLKETFTKTRARATSGREHLRIPEALAHLWLGLDCGLSYAKEIEACSASETEDLRDSCWEAFLTLARTQGQLIDGESPSHRFLRVLLALVTQQVGVLMHRHSPSTDVRGGAMFLGWQDAGAIYLIPDAAFTAVSRSCRESGAPFPISQDCLKRNLIREGIAEADTDRLTATVRVKDKIRRVIKLNIKAVNETIGEEFPSVVTDVTTVTGYG